MVMGCPKESLWGFFSSPMHSTPIQPSCWTRTLDHCASRSPCLSHFCSTHQVPCNVLNVLLMLTPIFKQNYEVSTINILLAQMRTWGTDQLTSLFTYLVTAKWLVFEAWSGYWAGVCSSPLCLLPSQLHGHPAHALRAWLPQWDCCGIGCVPPCPCLKLLHEGSVETEPTRIPLQVLLTQAKLP